MLKISKSVEYALLSLRYIAMQDHMVNTKEVSENVNIPYDLLAKILQKLNRQGIISSKQGAQGGYSLVNSPSSLSFRKIIEAVEQNIQLTDCLIENGSSENCKRFETCIMVDPMKRLQDKIIRLFDEISLEDLIKIKRS